MTVYTYSEARQKLATLLDQADAGNDIRIRRRDGHEFTLRPVEKVTSPLDVKGVDLSLSAQEIVDILREVRDR